VGAVREFQGCAELTPKGGQGTEPSCSVCSCCSHMNSGVGSGLPVPCRRCQQSVCLLPLSTLAVPLACRLTVCQTLVTCFLSSSITTSGRSV
jgi:hypothetical protein